RLVLVADQLEGEALLAAEVGVGPGRIARHPEDLRAERLELWQQRVEVTPLGGAAGGVVLGIEVQHQPLAGVRAQAGAAAVGKDQFQACRDRVAHPGGIGLARGAHQGTPQNFIGSMIASRLRWSQNSRKSSRKAAMCIRAGTPMVICAEYMSAPVCIAR